MSSHENFPDPYDVEQDPLVDNALANFKAEVDQQVAGITPKDVEQRLEKLHERLDGGQDQGN